MVLYFPEFFQVQAQAPVEGQGPIGSSHASNPTSENGFDLAPIALSWGTEGWFEFENVMFQICTSDIDSPWNFKY